jgi:hypothetical protein
MTKQTKKEGDELIWLFYPIKESGGRSIHKSEATKCAIIAQKRVIDEYYDIIPTVESEHKAFIQLRLDHAKQVLTYLESL